MPEAGPPSERTPRIDAILAETGSISPAVVLALAAQPALTATLGVLQGLLHGVDWLAPPGTETIELAIGILLLFVSILTYGYTVVLVTAYGYDVHAGTGRSRAAVILAAVAVTAQVGYLALPVYRVLGPASFEEVLFTVDDLVPLGVAAVATLAYIGMQMGRLAPSGRFEV